MLSLLDIVGQDSAIARLQRMYQAGRMSHAMLFVGSSGVGRRTTAEAWAAVLLCEKPQTRPNGDRFKELPADFPLSLACGTCPGCAMTAAGTHPDLYLVRKELARYHEDSNVRDRVMQELGIDVIRSFLIAPASLASARRRGKVFIVTEAELMSVFAQNSLLKTLEEPPPGVTIILICRRGGELLPTTLSRCVTVDFRPLPADFIRDRLRSQGMVDEQAAFWSAYADGSLGRAIRLAGRELYPVKRRIVERLAGLPKEGDAEFAEDLHHIAEDLAASAVAEAKKIDGAELSKNLASRQATGELLELIASAYRDALALATGSPRPPAHADQASAIASLAQRFGPMGLAEILEQLSELEEAIWRNVNPRLVWDNVVITAASAAPLHLWT